MMEYPMLKLHSLSLLLLVPMQAFAAGKKNEVFYADGEVATACGIVSSVVVLTKSSKSTTLINFGPEYPDHVFSVVIADEQLGTLDFKPDSLKGKRICVTGIIEKYKGKAQVELKNKDDIRLD